MLLRAETTVEGWIDSCGRKRFFTVAEQERERERDSGLERWRERDRWVRERETGG